MKPPSLQVPADAIIPARLRALTVAQLLDEFGWVIAANVHPRHSQPYVWEMMRRKLEQPQPAFTHASPPVEADF